MLLDTGLDFLGVLLVGVDSVKLVFADDLQRGPGVELALAKALASDLPRVVHHFRSRTLGKSNVKFASCKSSIKAPSFDARFVICLMDLRWSFDQNVLW